MTSFKVPAATLRTFIVANVTQRAPFCTERNGSIVKEPGGMQEQIQSPVVATVLPVYGDFCPDRVGLPTGVGNADLPPGTGCGRFFG